MSKTPGMMFWIDAYMMSTQRLSTVEHGAYLLILFAMWGEGGWLPDDDRGMALITRLRIDQWLRMKPKLRAMMVVEDGRVSQKRLLQELEKTNRIRTKNAEAGKASAASKALKRLEAESTVVEITLDDRSTTKTKTKKEEERKKDSDSSLRSESAAETDSADKTRRDWQEMKSGLVAIGVPLKSAGALIGKWLKDHKPDRIKEAIAEARNKGDPVSWLHAAMDENRLTHWQRRAEEVYEGALRGVV